MSTSSTPRSRGRAVSVVEPLDPRLLLAADAAALQARGFVPMEWQGNSVHVKAGEWIVGLQDVVGNTDAQIAAAGKKLSHLGFTVTRHLGGDGVLLVKSAGESLPNGVQKLVRKLPGVRYLQPNFALSLNQSPNDPDYQSGKLWGLNNSNDADIDAPEAWDFATGDSSAVVAVIDSGVDYTHPDLRDNMWVNPFDPAGDANGDGNFDDDGNGYVDDVHGANLITGSGNPMDDQGHGTHVAGTIAGVGNNGGGVVGVNWDASVMALKFLDSSGYGSSADAIEALHYAINMKNKGVNVVATNNSYGGEPWSRAFYDAIAASADPNKDGSPSDAILFVAASGNGDWRGRAVNNDSTPYYPSSYGHNGRTFDDPMTAVADNLPSLDTVISVTATDSNDAKASFGNYGSASVDLGAPGVNIWSAAIGGGYKYNSGTSMAAPHVAGAVALASAYNPGATAPEIKAAILGGVDIKSGLSRTSTGGRLNLHKTLVNLPVKVAPTAPQNLAADDVSSYEITVTWDDASGETHYVLQRYTKDAAGSPVDLFSVDLPQNTTRHSDTGLTPGTTYFYAIKAVNSVGASANPAEASAATPVLATPAAPTGLSATTAGASQINLAWADSNTDTLGYRIQRRTGTTADWQQIASIGAGSTNYSDTGLASGTTYYYRVFAFNHSTVSAASNEAAAATIGAAPVGTGTGLRGDYFDIDTKEAAADWWSDNPNNSKDNLKATRTDATVNFNWGTGKPVSQLVDGDTFAVRWSGLIQPRYSEAYTFYIGPLDDGVGLWVNGQKLIDPTTWERDGGKSLANTSPVTSTSIQLEAGQKYTIELKYYDWTGGANISLQWRSPSQAQQVVPTTQLYQGPSNLSATDDGSGRTKLAWIDNAASESGFKVERSTNGTKWTQIATVGPNVVSFVDTGLSDATTYYYRVRLYNDQLAFNSSYTQVATAQAGTAAGLLNGLATGDELFSSTLIAAM